MKTLIWRYVLYRLMKCELFRGTYDAANGSEHFMHGVESVMEYIAYNARRYREFNDIFTDNIVESVRRARQS